MGRTLYMMSSGELKRKENTIVVEGEQGRRFLPVETTDEILVFGEVTLNKRFLEFATASEIILHFFNHHGYYQGSYYPREHLNSGAAILSQARAYMDPGLRLDIAGRFVDGALGNMARVVGYYANREHPELEPLRHELEETRERIGGTKSVEELMGVEGNARERYYTFFERAIDDPAFCFGSRSRRPPANRLNALISFLNGMCYVLALSQIYRTHLDPRIGFLHETNFRRFSLNLDLAEIFKPILADRILLSLVNKREIQAKHFSSEGEGVYLNDTGREIVLRAWEERLTQTIDHPRLKRKVSYRGLVRIEAYKLEKHLLRDEVYEPFVSRW